LIKGSEILFTKVITIDDNPLSATIKSIHIVNNESLIVVEQLYNSSLKAYFLYKDERSNTAFMVKPFRSSQIRYPFYMFVHGSKEIWAINVKEPDFIHRFYVGEVIACMENYNPLNGEVEQTRIGMCI
jgi:hypothetical protein